MQYPRYITKGTEPKELTFSSIIHPNLYEYEYLGAIYYAHPNGDYYTLRGISKTEDSIKKILLVPQKLSTKGKVYTIFNTLTGQNMKLYNGKISWNSKGAATQSFVYYMQKEGITDFQSEDFHKLVKSGLIEVRELV